MQTRPRDNIYILLMATKLAYDEKASPTKPTSGELGSLPETTSSPCARGTPMVADGSHGDGKDLVRRVPNVGHTANLFAVCIYRHMAKKSEQTPSRPADGVGGSSPGACAVDTRQTYRLRSAPERQAHGKPSGFAVCPSGRLTAKDGHFAVCCVLAHGKVCFQAGPYGYFAVCQGHGTRQSDRRNPVFFLFFRFKEPHSNIYQYIYHRQHARHYI